MKEIEAPLTFSETLNNLLDRYEVTAKELASESGLSASAISRFRTGKATPKPGSEQLDRIAKALVAIANTDNQGPLSEDEILGELEETVPDKGFDHEQMAAKLNALISALSINAHDLSRYLNFDASYLSRIRSGQRKPANPQAFYAGAGAFAASRHGHDSQTIARVIGCSPDLLKSEEECRQEIVAWLLNGQAQQDADTEAVARFVRQLGEFDLQEYLSGVGSPHSSPVDPKNLPSEGRHQYTGIEGFKAAQLAWMADELANGEGDVIFYSDMPMEQMASDADFTRQWTEGIAGLLMKGRRIRIIHDVDRPLIEMILGLEGWIPLYMSGLIEPHYFRNMHDPVFHHYLAASNKSCLTGEAVKGSFEDGVFRFSNLPEDVSRIGKLANSMITRSTPLMEILLDGDIDADALAERYGYASAGEPDSPFNNIEIRVCDRCVIVTKCNAPVIHFVIRHPNLCRAIKSLVD